MSVFCPVALPRGPARFWHGLNLRVISPTLHPKGEKEGHNRDESSFDKGNLSFIPSGMPSEVHVGWAPSKWFEFGVGGIIALAKGGVLRGTVFVYNPDGAVKPFIGVQLPVLYTSDGIVLGGGASLGVQWDFWKHMGLMIEVPFNYMFAAPDGYAKNIIMGTAGVQVRF